MKIDVPFEIGDPIIKIEFNQHDGYYVTYKGFAYSDIPNIGNTVFSNYAEAKKTEDDLNSKRRNKN